MFDRDVLNKILLLMLIELANGVIHGATRLQSLVFTAESEGREAGVPTFNYQFIWWHLGPHSPEIQEDIKFLNSKGMLNKNINSIEITVQGREFLRKIRPVLDQHGVDKFLLRIINNYNIMRLGDLLRGVDFRYVHRSYENGETILHIRNDAEQVR